MLTVASVDWREVLLDLQHFYPKPKDVARELHGAVSEAAVRKYIEDATEPSHGRGELILDLWCRTTGKRREDAPRRLHEFDSEQDQHAYQFSEKRPPACSRFNSREPDASAVDLRAADA